MSDAAGRRGPGGLVVSPDREREKLLADLRFSLTMALSAVGESHPSRGRRGPYRPPLDFSDIVAPRLIERLVVRGWQFRHRYWTPGLIVGEPDSTMPIGPSTY